jgi:DNA modification methylase
MFGRYQQNQVVTGDSQDLATDIPDNSIDIIFTDPPYPTEYLYLYEWLAVESVRVLKPGGFLCTMSGGYNLDKVFALMAGKGLDWYFKVEVFNPDEAPVIWPRRIITRTKPVLMWTKGPSVIQIWNMTDVYQGQGKDKRYHRWGQDVGSARYVIEYVLGTGTKALLWEPFAGGGATLEACKILGIDYIASEVDPEVAQRARDRLAGVIKPTNPTQMSLFGATHTSL